MTSKVVENSVILTHNLVDLGCVLTICHTSAAEMLAFVRPKKELFERKNNGLSRSSGRRFGIRILISWTSCRSRVLDTSRTLLLSPSPDQKRTADKLALR